LGGEALESVGAIKISVALVEKMRG